MNANVPCDGLADGALELYFYEELDAAGRARVEWHLARCAECRTALDDLKVIRTALAARPDVSAPPGGDWSAFMARLDGAVQGTQGTQGTQRTRGTQVWLAMAALLALVTMSVLSVARWRQGEPVEQAAAVLEQDRTAAPVRAASPRSALAAASGHHLERSKLVLLGLTSKDADAALPEEWTYERELANGLLTDTRLYRRAAEERGMTTLAGVLRDLELVLLQTSFTESDPQALGQIQRLIRKRDLIEKMDVVATSGI